MAVTHAAGEPEAAYASIAGLPESGRWVRVGPPLSDSAPSCGFTARTVPDGLQPDVDCTMFVPVKVGLPAQSGPIAAVFPATIDPVTDNVPPTRSNPPPIWSVALFALIVDARTVAVLLLMMPPPSGALLPVTVLFSTVRVASELMPPPIPIDVLAAMVLCLIVVGASTSIPPPSRAAFPLTVLFASVRLPDATRMPPPSCDVSNDGPSLSYELFAFLVTDPLRITTPSIVTPVAAVLKTRSLPPPSIVVAVAPGCRSAPTIVMGFESVNAPAVNVYTPAGTFTVTPESAFASAIAARSVHGWAAVGGCVAHKPVPAASVESVVEFTVYDANVVALACGAVATAAGTRIAVVTPTAISRAPMRRPKIPRPSALFIIPRPSSPDPSMPASVRIVADRSHSPAGREETRRVYPIRPAAHNPAVRPAAVHSPP